MRYEEASARTVALVDELLGGGADRAAIGQLLRRHRVRLLAGRDAAASVAGQELLLTAALLVRRMGMAVEVDAPNAPLVAEGPPVIGGTLHEALRSVESQLLPETTFELGKAAAIVDLEFLLGSVKQSGAARRVLRVGVSGSRAVVAPTATELAINDERITALAAAGVLAAQAFRSFAADLAEQFNIEIAKDFGFEGGCELDVGAVLGIEIASLASPALGRIDFISAGAITNAALYTLFRLDARLEGRAIEGKVLDPPDLNRYLLALARHLDVPKVDILSELSRGAIRLEGEPVLYDEETRRQLEPLAETVVVGVDHVPSRWLVQSAEPQLLVVGATEGFEAYASFHRPGIACAGCLHPTAPPDEATRTVPTISFVSFFAGFFQALLLAALASGQEPKGQVIRALPFAFAGPIVSCTPLAGNPNCPVGCPASRIAREAA